eukprot:EG_transcript_47089
MAFRSLQYSSGMLSNPRFILLYIDLLRSLFTETHNIPLRVTVKSLPRFELDLLRALTIRSLCAAADRFIVPRCILGGSLCGPLAMALCVRPSPFFLPGPRFVPSPPRRPCR